MLGVGYLSFNWRVYSEALRLRPHIPPAMKEETLVRAPEPILIIDLNASVAETERNETQGLD